MNVSVANTAKFDIELYIVRPCVSASDLVRLQESFSGVRGVAGNKGHLSLRKINDEFGKHETKSCQVGSNSVSLAGFDTQRISDLAKSYQETGFVIIIATR